MSLLPDKRVKDVAKTDFVYILEQMACCRLSVMCDTKRHTPEIRSTHCTFYISTLRHSEHDNLFVMGKKNIAKTL